jgi:ABC-type sugar transport system ATPase subunit
MSVKVNTVMVSSVLPEILRMSHRIVAMCEGRVTAVQSAEGATPEKIMYYATLRNEAVSLS